MSSCPRQDIARRSPPLNKLQAGSSSLPKDVTLILPTPRWSQQYVPKAICETDPLPTRHVACTPVRLSEWGPNVRQQKLKTSASVTLETVKATVGAFAKGIIDICVAPSSGAVLRISTAPGYIPEHIAAKDLPRLTVERSTVSLGRAIYTSSTLAEFLGWGRKLLSLG